MRRIRISALLLAVFVLLSAAPGACAEEPQIAGEAALLIDLSTGQCLYEKNPDQRMYPASTTKILTALLALKHGELDDVVTVGPSVNGVEGTSIYLKEGEQITLEDLLWALLLNSGNDAAIAIAEHIAGSVDNFVAMMNNEARRLGAVNSNFVNPNGLHEDEHYSTARDLSLIAIAAIQDPRFRGFVATTTKHISREDPEAVDYLVNTNKLLWRYEGAAGIKTGYTSKAHQCLVALAERDGRELMAVVLKNQNQDVWTDCAALLDYGFNEFVSVEVVPEGMPVCRIPVVVGREELNVVTGRGLQWVFPVRNTEPVVHWETILEKEIKAPIQEGESVGRMVISYNDEDLGSIPLVAGNDVARPIQTHWYFWAGVVFGGMTLAAYGTRFTVKTLRGSRRRRR